MERFTVLPCLPFNGVSEQHLTGPFRPDRTSFEWIVPSLTRLWLVQWAASYSLQCFSRLAALMVLSKTLLSWFSHVEHSPNVWSWRIFIFFVTGRLTFSDGWNAVSFACVSYADILVLVIIDKEVEQVKRNNSSTVSHDERTIIVLRFFFVFWHDS